jgi:hypothetical protein
LFTTAFTFIQCDNKNDVDDRENKDPQLLVGLSSATDEPPQAMDGLEAMAMPQKKSVLPNNSSRVLTTTKTGHDEPFMGDEPLLCGPDANERWKTAPRDPSIQKAWREKWIIITMDDGVEVDLRQRQLGDEGATAVASALTHNSTLQLLWLSTNRIGNEGATALANALTHNSTLELLCLGHNTIGDEGATALANALTHNSRLQELYLGHNTIGDEGATALANALTHNSTLKLLTLALNTIGDEGATALLDCFKGISPLQERWQLLSNSKNGYDGMVVLNACIEALEKSLKFNVTLTSLVLGGNTNISQALVVEIDSVLSQENLEKRRQEKALLALLLTG